MPKFTSAINEERPSRLSEVTREFAWDSLLGKYGRELKESPFLEITDEDFTELSEYRKYDRMIEKIAKEAPLRFCEGELLCGSATLFSAISHYIPVKFQGEFVLESVSHVTLGFDQVLKVGLDEYKNRIENRAFRSSTPKEKEVLDSFMKAYEAIKHWHGRYISELFLRQEKAGSEEKKRYYRELYENLKGVPFSPPQSFRQAVQALWFTFAFTRLCGNWSGIGRIDVMLGDFLKADLQSGKITIEEARELMAHFFIKGCEWITLEGQGSGDAQHYQNIILAGVDENGKEVTNEATYLVLDVLEELSISDFPIAVRINAHTPKELLKRMAETMRHGGGVIAVYNEELIINSLVEFGYPLEEARTFANDGCWEVQIPGKTYFAYFPVDGFELFQNSTLCIKSKERPQYKSYEEIKETFKKQLSELIFRKQREIDNTFAENGEIKRNRIEWRGYKELDENCALDYPCSVVSILTEGYTQNAKGYYVVGGPKYTVRSMHMAGLIDTANSLYAIKKLVFEEKKVTLDALLDTLQNNWDGYEDLRLYVRNKYCYFGNDHDEVDEIVAELTDHFIAEMRKVKRRAGILRPPGVSTFGRQINPSWLEARGASVMGTKKGEGLSNNFSPAPGTDHNGATALIRSHCKSNLKDLTCGTALDIKLYPTSVMGEEGKQALIALVQGFRKLGGFFMQLDVIDNAVLMEAKKYPEQYQSLAVRVSGWSARFVTLDEDWQNIIIHRSAQGV